MPKVTLPPELIHKVLDFLANDLDSLNRCAASSHTLASIADAHIYRDINILIHDEPPDPSEEPPTLGIDEFLELLEKKSHIKPFIRTITLNIAHKVQNPRPHSPGREPSSTDPPLLELPGLLAIKLCSSQVKGRIKWNTIPAEVRLLWESLIPNPSVKEVGIQRIAEFPISYLQSCHGLKNLGLFRATFDRSHEESLVVMRARDADPQFLQHLRVSGFAKPVYEWLTSDQTPSGDSRISRLSSLNFEPAWEDFESINVLTAGCSTSLKRLVVNMDDPWKTFNTLYAGSRSTHYASITWKMTHHPVPRAPFSFETLTRSTTLIFRACLYLESEAHRSSSGELITRRWYSSPVPVISKILSNASDIPTSNLPAIEIYLTVLRSGPDSGSFAEVDFKPLVAVLLPSSPFYVTLFLDQPAGLDVQSIIPLTMLRQEMKENVQLMDLTRKGKVRVKSRCWSLS